MSPSVFLLLCIQACIFQAVWGSCGCGYSTLPAPVSYGGSCGCGGGSIGISSYPSIPSGGCGEISVANVNYGSTGYIGGSGSAGYIGGSGAISSASLGQYGGVGTGQVGVSGEVLANGNTVVVGSVPVLGAVDFSGVVPAVGSVSISGQCGCGCGCI